MDTAQNSCDNLLSYPPDDQHSSDVVCWAKGQRCSDLKATQIQTEKITQLIIVTTLTWFALFSQRLVLYRLSTSHDHLACVNGILHHHRFLCVKFRFRSETFEEPFAETTNSAGFNDTLTSLFKSHTFITVSYSDSHLLTTLYFTLQQAMLIVTL